ncbi:hypothetical protein Rs2_21022 [Raphanus sativus]|nr:hypothetical protein Rs2_21022 [Raphanus sativus]
MGEDRTLNYRASSPIIKLTSSVHILADSMLEYKTMINAATCRPLRSLSRFHRLPISLSSSSSSSSTQVSSIDTGLVGAPACGDVMKLQIKVDDSYKTSYPLCSKASETMGSNPYERTCSMSWQL